MQPRLHTSSHSSPQPGPTRSMPEDGDITRCAAAGVPPATLFHAPVARHEQPTQGRVAPAAAPARAPGEAPGVCAPVPPPPLPALPTPPACATPVEAAPPSPPPAPTTQRLCVLASGVLVFHVLTSALQERIFHLPGFTNVLLLSGGETFCTMTLAACMLVWRWWRAGMPVRAGAAPAPTDASSARLGEGGDDDASDESDASSSNTFSERGSRAVVPNDVLRNRDRTAHTPGTSSGNGSTRVLAGSSEAASTAIGVAAVRTMPGDRGDGHRVAEHSHISLAALHPRSFRFLFRRGSAILLCLGSVRSCLRRGAITSVLCDIFHPSTVQLRWYVRIAVLVSCSLYLTNRTSLLLSYALQVIFKSSKLLCMILVHRWWTRSRAGGALRDGSEADVEVAELADVAKMKLRCGGVDEEEVEEEQNANVAADATRRCARHAGNPVAVRVDGEGVGDTRSGSHPLQGTGAAAGRGAFCAERGTHPLSPEPRPLRSTTTITPMTSSNSTGLAVWVRHAMARVWSAAQPRRGGGDGDADFMESTTSNGTQRGRARRFALSGVVSRTVSWVCRQAGGLLRDTEMLACVVIVLGLISFTYASELERRARAAAATAEGAAAAARGMAVLGSVSTRGASLPGGGGGATRDAAAARVADPLAAATPTSVFRAVLQLMATGAVPTASASPTTSAAAVWAVTVVGVAGVLLSNVMDSVMYILEELHCFHADDTHGSATISANTKGSAAAAKTHSKPVVGVLADLDAEAEPAAAYRGAAAVPQTGVVTLRHTTATQECGSVDSLLGASRGSSSAPSSCARTCPHTSLALARAADTDAHLTDQRASATPTQAEHRVSATAAAAVPATSPEVLFMVNGFATLLYSVGIALSSCYNLVHPTVAALTVAELRELALCEASVAARGKLRAATVAAPVVLSAPCRALVARHYELLQRRYSPLVVTTKPATESFSAATFVLLIATASVTSMIGTLCLLRIIAEYTGVMAVVVTSARKTATILLSFLLYRRRFTLLHGLGLAGVMGGVVCYELQRRRAGGHRGKRRH